ncbi:uncharacterized protein LOC119735551 [Patiria miniata]|uniref:C2H2-type domain-containing protein n=1 Tax=Patiria miniata TaxID=46514 RepID=A0A914ANM3_PATMI|nr:uncharacterized protein LOC119735551 [Patiria miniata]
MLRMEADSTSDKIPEDYLETSGQEVPETMETTLVSNGSEERSLSDLPRRDQHAFSGGHGSSTVSSNSDSINESFTHAEAIQQAMEDTAGDSLCDLSFSEARNDGDASSVREPASDGVITATDEAAEIVETSVSSKCLLEDDIRCCPVSTTLTDVSGSEPDCQSETGGSQMSDNPNVAGDSKAMEVSKATKSAQAADAFQTVESSHPAECPKTAIGSKATEGSSDKGSSESLRGCPSTEDPQASEFTYALWGLQSTAGSQVSQGSSGTEHSLATNYSQTLRGSHVTDGSQATGVSLDMEGSQAMDGSHTREDDKVVKGSKSSEVPQVSSLAALDFQVPVHVGADSTATSATNMSSTNLGTPVRKKGVQAKASCSDSMTGVKTSGKFTNEDDDLYSEIIATNTKVKILKKYFGDTRKPGLCHRPHHKKYYGSFKCRECHLSFSYLPSLLLHSNKHGKQYHMYKCSKCNYKSSAPGAFTKHELNRHPVLLFQCYVCMSTFLQESTLRRHKEACHLSKPVDYVCKLCKGVFSSHSTLTEHLKLQHMIVSDCSACKGSSDAVGESNRQPDASFQQKFYCVVPRTSKISKRCKKCKALFPPKDKAFVQHRQAYEVAIKPACVWCGYRGTSACDLSCHKRQVHNWCLVCNWKLGNKGLLDQHTKIVHHGFGKKESLDKGIQSQKKLKEEQRVSSHQEHRCPHVQCHQRVYSEVGLEQHIKEVHEQDETRPFIVNVNTEAVQHWYCTTCNVIFPTKRLLELHIRLNHRPMKKTETSPLVQAEPTEEDQEWRCLLCNTLHHTLEECNKHQITHHPDEYEYISRKEIAEPSQPLPVSALSDTGPPYTCSMCDSKVSSVEELHLHKKQFHRIAYTLSIKDKVCPERTIYRCRYRCGFANSIRKHVLKHEPTCLHKTTAEPKVWGHPPIVLDSSSGKMVHNQESASTISEPASSKKSQELEADHPEIKEKAGSEADPHADNTNQDESMEASSEKGVDQSVVHRQEETVKPASSNLKPALSQTVSTIPSGQLKPSKPSTSGFGSTSASNKIISKSSINHPQGSKLPVYGKHDVITSSSDDDSSCSWLDKSSDSEESEEAMLTENSVVDSSPMSSEGEDGQTESVQEAPTLCPQGQAAGLGGQHAQVKPPAPSTNPHPPLLQPTVLMRFFQAIDLSDLYRLALQMITGSPQPHSLPTSDPAMVSSKVAKFKYKIPLGYSHPEFKEIPLFPSSNEAKILGNLQTLPTSLINKHYRGVLAKPFHNYLSSLVDSAVISNFSENTIKGVERYVRKQRVDDRKDITSSLSRYIVSQYVKNQQKKPPGTQPIPLSIGATNNPVVQSISRSVSAVNSPGAGPSGAQSRPPAIRLVITKSAVPVAKVKYMGVQPSAVNASGAPVQANIVVSRPLQLTTTLLNMSPSKFPSESTCNLGVPTAATVVNPSAVSQTKPLGMAASGKNTHPQDKSGKRVQPGPKVKRSPAATKSTKIKPAVYSVPVRRSPRLLKSAGDLPSSSGSSNGLADLEKCDTLPKQNDQSKGKKSCTPKTTVDNGTSDPELEETRTDKMKTKHNEKPTYRGRCKDGQSETAEDGTDNGNPKSLPKPSDPTLLPQLGFTGIAVAPRNGSSANGQTQQVNSKHNLMLQMVPGPRLPMLSLNTKLPPGSILAETIDREGVIQTRMARHPLHGLNGGTVPRLIAPNNGSFLSTGQAVPQNRTMFFMNSVPVNLQPIRLPDKSTILPGLSLKAPVVQVNPQSLGSRRSDPLVNRVLCPDTNKNMEHVTHELDVSTSPGLSSLPSEEQLIPQSTLSTQPLSTRQVSAGDKHNSTASKWKMTLTMDDVLAIMAKRKLQRFSAYKPLPSGSLNQADGSTEVSSKDQLQTCDIDKNDSNSTVNTLKRKSKQRASSESVGTPQKKVCKVMNDCCSEEALPNQLLCAQPLVFDSEILEKSGTTSNSNQRNPHSICTKFVEGDDEQQSTTEQAEQAADSTREEEKTSTSSEELVEESCSDATSKTNSEMTNPDTTEETNITRRSLRTRDAKRKTEPANKLNNKKRKTTVDHSYMKNPQPDSSDNRRKLRALRQRSKGSGMPREAKRESTGSKTSADRRLVPHDHSYTGSRPQRSSPRLKATSKMDHSYFWKTQDGMRANGDSDDAGSRQDSTVSVGKVTFEVDRKLPRAEDLRGSVEDHASSHDHSYSASFPQNVQDQMAAMDHCYVRLTPISIGSKRQVPQATTMQPSSPVHETFQAERKHRKVAEDKSSTSDAALGAAGVGSSKHDVRRTLRSSDQSHTK